MAFVSALVKRFVTGPYKVKIFSYTQGGGDTGGVIKTSFKTIKAVFDATETSQSATTNLIELNEGSGGAEAGSVKMTTVANEDGHIIVFGF